MIVLNPATKRHLCQLCNRAFDNVAGFKPNHILGLQLLLSLPHPGGTAIDDYPFCPLGHLPIQYAINEEEVR